LNLLISLLIIILLVAGTGIYVAAEFAAVRSRRTRISQMSATGNSQAQLLLPILEDRARLDNFIAACQIGITITSLIVGAYSQRTLTEPLSQFLTNTLQWGAPSASSISSTVILIAITALSVVMAELVPKAVALRYPEETALFVVQFMRISEAIFRPFTWFFNGSGNLILHLMGREPVSESNLLHSPEEIEMLVSDSTQGGLLDAKEQQLLRNAFRMRDLIARQVMTPRTQLVAQPDTASVTNILSLANAESFSRIPIFKDNADNMIGYVHVKDVFRLHLERKGAITDILRPVIFVPETLPIAVVWEKVNAAQTYIAIVFDEYGGTAGMITFEDLIEEVTGELRDEFDEDEVALASSDKAGRIYLRGDLLVDDINEYMNLNLPTEESDTLGGLVFTELGRVPEEGDEVTLGEPPITLRVEEMDERRIVEVSLQMSESQQAQETPIEWEVEERDESQ
jgi:CBS domain containing-hemolysin-like protein